jgi:replicative DNA helicase Mcm
VLTPESVEAIRDYYIRIRKQGEGEEASVPLTARQLEAFVRLAEAAARTRLSDRVEIEDAERGIRIVDYFLKKIMGGEKFDIDVIATGISHSQRERMRVLLDIIDRGQAKEVLKRLVSDGRVYQPTVGTYRTV